MVGNDLDAANKRKYPDSTGKIAAIKFVRETTAALQSPQWDRAIAFIEKHWNEASTQEKADVA